MNEKSGGVGGIANSRFGIGNSIIDSQHAAQEQIEYDMNLSLERTKTENSNNDTEIGIARIPLKMRDLCLTIEMTHQLISITFDKIEILDFIGDFTPDNEVFLVFYVTINAKSVNKNSQIIRLPSTITGKTKIESCEIDTMKGIIVFDMSYDDAIDNNYLEYDPNRKPGEDKEYLLRKIYFYGFVIDCNEKTK